MSVYRPRRAPHPPAAVRTPARLHRITAAAAAVICGLLTLAGVVPAASAIIRPDPGFGRVTPLTPVPAAPNRVVIPGGMAGWQIALIALGAAVIAAVAAVMLDRALTARRAAPAPTATRPGQPRPDEITSPPGWR